MFKYILLFSLFTTSIIGAEYLFEGTWKTVNRKLDGTMKCKVTITEKEKWKGYFDGEWRGDKFAYNVEWTGPPDKLVGKARIDGASYDWKGTIDQKVFKGTFDGSRYNGSFHLERIK